jgi:hypothetical protein
MSCYLEGRRQKYQEPDSDPLLQRYGSADPNPYQNVAGPQHYLSVTSVSQTNSLFILPAPLVVCRQRCGRQRTD